MRLNEWSSHSAGIVNDLLSRQQILTHLAIIALFNYAICKESKILLKMNGPQRTAVSRKELREIRKQKNFLNN